MPNEIKISPGGSLRGVIELPGDKSISHRAAMLASISTGKTVITNYSPGEDCGSTLKCLRQLGVSIDEEGSAVCIEGVGKHGFAEPDEPLDCGNSGTTMRLLSGLLAGNPFKTKLTGDSSLSKRPMARIADPLELSGATVVMTNRTAPIAIQGVELTRSYVYSLPVDSAQVKSCVLFTGLYSDQKVVVKGFATVNGLSTSRDHTERMLRYLGAEIEEEVDGKSHTVTVYGKSILTGKNIDIPSDVSSAAFFLVAAAGIPGSRLLLKNVGLNPTRSGVISVLKEAGARIEISGRTEICNEPRGDIEIEATNKFRNEPLILAGKRITNLIDEIPILAVFGTLLPGGIEIRDAKELRVKESDRIAAVVDNLAAMNADVEEFEDGFAVRKSSLKGAVIKTFGDHRIAMAFAVAGLFADGETQIDDPDCASVSLPGFYDLLWSLGRND
jgi:3-phosphoshikimate 1-carboxyvinyltransferase